MTIMRYRNFYNTVDREKEYAAGRDVQDHSAFSAISGFINKYSLSNKKALEIGSGDGKYQDLVLDYTGIDVSEGLSKFYNKDFIVVKDGAKYPFENETFDFVFTNAVFEHIPNVDLALKEMIRVTKKGGYIFFNPAWQCRPWAANGYQVRPYSDFNIAGKIYKALIPLMENLLFRLTHVMPFRLYHLISFNFRKKLYSDILIYKRLKPNYEKYWQADSDACNSIDPFMAILYFRANCCNVINYTSMINQFLVRTNAIILKKM